MKRFCLSILLLAFICRIDAQILYDDFEDTRIINYRFTSGVLDENSANPNANGLNSSPICAQYDRDGTNLFDQITIDFPYPLDSVRYYVNREKRFFMDVYSPAVGVVIEITLYNDSLSTQNAWPRGRHSQYNDTTTVANAWERLEFFHYYQPDSLTPDTILDAMSITIAPNTNLSNTFFLDNIYGPAYKDPCLFVAKDDSVFDDFECNSNLTYFFTSGDLTTVPNPEKEFVNGSNFVGKYERDATTVDDVIVGSPGRFLDLAANPFFKLHVYDPNPPHTIILSLKYDDGINPAQTVHDMVRNTVFPNDWQEIYFDASAISGSTNVNLLVLLIDPSNAASGTYYLDNFTQVPTNNPMSINDPKVVRTWDSKISPNPSSGKFKVDIASQRPGDLSLRVTDIHGKEVFASQQALHPGASTLDVELAELPAGVYFVILELNGVKEVKKLIFGS